MVASHDHVPVAASLLIVWSENEVPAFPILDQVRTCGYVERGAQVPLLKVEGQRAAGGFGPPLLDFGLVAPIGSTVRDLLLQSREEAGWGLLPVLCVLPTGKTADWHWWIDSRIFSPSISLEGCGRRDVYVFPPILARQSVVARFSPRWHRLVIRSPSEWLSWCSDGGNLQEGLGLKVPAGTLQCSSQWRSQGQPIMEKQQGEKMRSPSREALVTIL